MANTPVTWLEQFIVNTTTTGGQSDPDIIQLANGNILVSWTSSDDTGAGSNAGTDIIGRIFDPMGNPVTGELTLNTIFTVDNENNSDLVALPGGGFIMVYQDVESGGTAIRLQEYTSTGAFVSANTTVAQYSSTINFHNPRIAAASDTSVFITYEKTTGGVTTVVGKTYNPSSDTYSSEISLLAASPGDSDPDVTALTNGNYVITATHNVSGDQEIAMRIVSGTGANVLSFTTIAATAGDGFNDNEASVTALTGGGFVVSYTDKDSNDFDVTYKVFNSAGTLLSTGTAGNDSGSATNNNNESCVAGLSDGSFVVVVDNDEKDTMEVTHVSASGTFLGSTQFTGSGTEPAVTDLGDGRFAIAWTSTDATGEIKTKIMDTRDFTNSTAVYTPSSWQVGTVGDDTFTAASGANIVHAYKGDDVVTESGIIKSYFMDEGSDTLKVVSQINSDVHDGGDGNDTIDWTGASLGNGAVFNLKLGTAVLGVSSEVMVHFENIIGTNGGDTLVGDDDVNTLNGAGGDDTIMGGLGVDVLVGGTGDDTIKVLQGEVGGNVDGGADTDTLDLSGLTTDNAVVNLHDGTWTTSASATILTITNVEVVIGGDNKDTVIGGAAIDTIQTGGSSDVIKVLQGDLGDNVDGGADKDLLDLSGLITDKAIVNLQTGIWTTSQSSTQLTIVNIESVNGGGGDDSITGDDANGNHINGGAGNDFLEGRGGNDTLIGGAGNDTLFGGADNDLYVLSNGHDIVFDTSGIDTATSTISRSLHDMQGVENLTLLGSSNISGRGDNNNNTIKGNDHNNKLYGEGGHDKLYGYGGNDTLDGGTNSDSMYGGTGNDTYIVNSTSDKLSESGGGGTDLVKSSVTWKLASGFENLTLTGTGNINGTGTDSNNTIKGNSHNNKLFGEGGHDKLYGYGGNDTLDGGSNSDTMYGGTGNDTYIVNSGSDKVSEASGGGTDLVKSSVTWKLASGFENLTLTGTSKINATGTSGNNVITGNSAHNVLTGGGGNDTFVFKTALVASHYDTITDFGHTTDRFDIDNAVFKGLSTGTLSANDFKLISSATSTAGVDSSDRILYDRNHGNLYFDQDGSKTGHSRILFAHVDNGTFINNTDFHII